MDVFRRDREFDVSALQGRLSTSSQSQCSTDPGLIAGTWHRPLFLTRDRWFESTSLQQRVTSVARIHVPTAVSRGFPLDPVCSSYDRGRATAAASKYSAASRDHEVDPSHLPAVF